MPPLPPKIIPAPPQPRLISPIPGARTLLVHGSGNVSVHRIQFHIDSRLAGQTILVIETPETVTFTDLDGTVILERPWPAPGITYVSNGHPRGPRRKHPPTSPMS